MLFVGVHVLAIKRLFRSALFIATGGGSLVVVPVGVINEAIRTAVLDANVIGLRIKLPK